MTPEPNDGPMKLPSLLLLACTALALPAQAQQLLTAPEKSDFEETTRYDDVVAFMKQVSDESNLMHMGTFGTTFEGRAMPMIVVGRGLRDGSPATVRASGKTRVYLQGNIHGGEVEGKEVLLMLLRDFARGEHAAWLDSLVLIVVPIYNSDGNEKVQLRNRGPQHGPLKGMGVRPNAQELDLNRDHMKMVSPEARAVVKLMADYDPHVGVDLHTTNGSFHGYHLTYAPPLHPATNAGIVSMLRDRMLPEITTRVKNENAFNFYYYGNVNNREQPRAWGTFDHRPRFNNNYVGLRNRVAILSEAYSYDTFIGRIRSTRAFVLGILDHTARNASAIRTLTEQADAETIVGRQLPVRAQFHRGGQIEILMGDVAREVNPYSGDTIYRRLEVAKPEMMTDLSTFEGVEPTTVPRYYFLPPDVPQALRDNLANHGVRTRTLTRDSTVMAERFRIDSTTVAARPFQNQRERTLFGAYETPSNVSLKAGTIVVDVAQPLGRLAFYLIEPRSDDGYANWNFFDPAIESSRYYPIVRASR